MPSDNHMEATLKVFPPRGEGVWLNLNRDELLALANAAQEAAAELTPSKRIGVDVGASA